MVKISAFIVTKNQEKNIKRCLESIKWVDEIIVIDGYSTDKTPAICKKYGARIYKTRIERAQDKLRNMAIPKCKYEWIFEIDSDEEATPELKKGIFEAIQRNPDKDGFKIKREEQLFGERLYYAQKIRLYKNAGFKYKGYTHEVLQISNNIGKVRKGFLKHYKNKTMDELLYGTRRYSDIDSYLLMRGEKISRFKLLMLMLFRPWYEFFMYFIYFRFCFKGFKGLIFSTMGAIDTFATYAKYYEKVYAREKRAPKK